MDCCTFAVPYIYNTKKNFVYTGNYTATAYCGTEGSVSEFQSIVATTIAKVNEVKILNLHAQKKDLKD